MFVNVLVFGVLKEKFLIIKILLVLVLEESVDLWASSFIFLFKVMLYLWGCGLKIWLLLWKIGFLILLKCVVFVFFWCFSFLVELVILLCFFVLCVFWCWVVRYCFMARYMICLFGFILKMFFGSLILWLVCWFWIFKILSFIVLCV